MVRTVVLVRHGKSASAQSGSEDASRPLTPAGLRAIKATYPRTFALLEDSDVHIWTSPYSRAFQTAEVVSQVVGDGCIEGHYSLARSDAKEFLRDLLESSGETVIAVGHNPMIEDTAAYLLGYRVPFEKGTAAAIALSGIEGNKDPKETDLSGELLWFVKGPDWHRWKVLQRLSDAIAQASDEYSAASLAAFSSNGETQMLDDALEKAARLRAFLSFVRPFAREHRVVEVISYLDDRLVEMSRLHSYDVLCREIASRRYAAHSRIINNLGSGLNRQEDRPLSLDEQLTAPDPQPTLYEHACKVRGEAWERMYGIFRSKKEMKSFDCFVEKAHDLKWRRRIEEGGLPSEMIQARYWDLSDALVEEWRAVYFGDRKAVRRLRFDIERIVSIGDDLLKLSDESPTYLPQALLDSYEDIKELCNVRTMRTILAHWDTAKLYGEATYQMVALNSQLAERENRLIAKMELARA